MSKTVLVTGATGFVGRHACAHLIQMGYRVRATCRKEMPPQQGVEWIQINDISGDTDWSESLKGVDYVLHLAGLAHRVGLDDTELKPHFQRLNYHGTVKLAEDIARSPHVKRLVFVSSAKAVLDFSEDMLTPETEPSPLSEYGISKLQAENAISEVLADTACDWCVIRPCLVYGPGNLGNMQRLIRLILTGVPLPFGAIRNRKSFVYVGNLSDCLERCLWHRGVSRRRLFVSDNGPMSTAQLVRKLGDISGKKIALLPVPVAALKLLAFFGDGVKKLTGRSIGWDTYSVERLCSSISVDSSETFRRLEWHPSFTFDEAMTRTMEEQNSIDSKQAVAAGA